MIYIMYILIPIHIILKNIYIFVLSHHSYMVVVVYVYSIFISEIYILIIKGIYIHIQYISIQIPFIIIMYILDMYLHILLLPYSYDMIE